MVIKSLSSVEKALTACAFFLLLLLLFGRLGDLPIRAWDEARYSINAIEMAHSNNFLITHYEGLTDQWNTKPPLALWLEVLFIKWMGISELAIRIPSALAGLFTFIFLFFEIRTLRLPALYGLICWLVLMTSGGYICMHGTRTGDFDSLLVLWGFLFSISYFNYMRTAEKRSWYACCLFLGLAVLTKGVSPLLFLPGLFLHTLFQNKLRELVKQASFYKGVLLVLSLATAYYGLREIVQPGYLHKVYVNEMGPRYFNALEGNRGEFGFYLDYLVSTGFFPWIYLVPLGFISGILSKIPLLKQLTLFSGLFCISYFLIISAGQTKVIWYSFPLFPYLSILAGIPIYIVITSLSTIGHKKISTLRIIIPICLLILLFFFPYINKARILLTDQETPEETDYYAIEHFLKDATKGYEKVDHFILVDDGFRARYRFYAYQLAEQNIQLSFKSRFQLLPGDSVLLHQWDVKDYVESKFNVQLIQRKQNIFKFYLRAFKTN